MGVRRTIVLATLGALGACASPARPAATAGGHDVAARADALAPPAQVSGRWSDNDGRNLHTYQDGGLIQVADRTNRRSFKGEVHGSTVMLAGRTGEVSQDGRYIHWSNGSVWRRSVAGRWLGPAGANVMLKQLGKDVLAVDLEEQVQHEGTIEGGVLQLDGKQGAISSDYTRIEWADGVTWQKAP